MKKQKILILLIFAFTASIGAMAQDSEIILFDDDFNDGDFTADPTWNLTAGGTGCWAPGTREVVNGTFHVRDMDSGGCGHATMIDSPLDINIDDSTRVEFDVNPVFSDVTNGAGNTHEEYPANVDIYLLDDNGITLQLRFCYNYRGGSSLTTSTYIRVAFPNVPQNVWQLDQKFRIRQYFPNAMTITKITIGAIGWNYESYFDNIQLYSTDTLNIFTTCQTSPGCAGLFLVPVQAFNCDNVGAISMKLNYNNTVLSYVGYQNVHPALSSGYLYVNSNGSRVSVSWASTTPANIGNDTLLQLRFTAYPGISALNWVTQPDGNCEYSDINGQVLPSEWINSSTTVIQPPIITAHPVNHVTAASYSTTFTVVATGAGLGYQWQLSTNGGSSWADLSNGEIYSNVTNATMSISNTTLGMNGYRYHCRISGTCLPVAFSNQAILTVTPLINTTCQTITDCPGEIVIPLNVSSFMSVGAFSLKLNFNPSILTYSGYQNLSTSLYNGTFLDNSNGGSVFLTWYSTSAATLTNGSVLVELLFNGIPGTSTMIWDTITPGSCEYTGITGQVMFSDWINGVATIHQPPIITSHPVNRVIAVGNNTTYTVAASGAGLLYQWQLSTDGGSSWSDLNNGGVYSNVMAATMNITGAILSMHNNRYRCKVSGTCTPAAFSNQALLTVTPTVVTTCQPVTHCPGQITVPLNVSSFMAVGAFSMKLNINTSILTYSGYQNLNPALEIGTFEENSNGGSVFLTWYSTSPTTLANGSVLVELLFNGIPGTSAMIWDTITPGSCEYTDITGQVMFSDWINGTTTVLQPPLVVTQPLNRTIPSGNNTTFTVTATGAGLTYQWQLSTNGGINWTDLSNGGYYSNVTTATLGITGAALGMSGHRYRCRVSGTCTPIAYSNAGLLIVTPNIITSCRTITDCPGDVVIPLTVTNFIGVGAFTLKLNFNASALTYSTWQNLNSALAPGTFMANSSGGSIYLTWYNTSAATIPNGDTLSELVFTGVPGTSTMIWDTITPGSCEYSDITGQVIFADWINGNTTVLQPPLVTVQPPFRTIFAGSSTTFPLTATGAGLTYQWQENINGGINWTDLINGGVYSNVTTTTLGITNAPYSMNGFRYRCKITGTCEPVAFTNPALLTVTPTPITTTAASISNSCTCNLAIPVTVNNFNNVGSISLTLQYDTTKLSFQGYGSVHPELSTGFFLVLRTGNKIKLTWASTTPADIGTGTLVEYRFKAIANISTTLSWVTTQAGSCEYSNIDGVVITSYFNNGNISVLSNAMLVDAGDDIYITPGDTAELNGVVTGGTGPFTYLWTPANYLSDPAIANPLVSPPVKTTYTLTVTASNGCTGSDIMEVIPVYNLPEVTTDSITNITYISATGGGNVTSDGGTAVTARGICWDTGNLPTITDSRTSDGTGTGSFVSLITWLTPSTNYNVRAYAINAMGVVYGEQLTFTALMPPINQPPDIDSIPDPVPIDEDSGLQTVNLTSINDGNTEYIQNISITASSSNTSIIPHPAVTYTPNDSTGSISYTPVPDANGNVTITVTVMDDGGTANGGMNTTNINFTVVVLPTNDPPTAEAGPNQTVGAAQLVTLNGSVSSDIDGDSLLFSWTAPAGITLSDPAAMQPTFIAPPQCITKNYTFSLVVNDGTVSSVPDIVMITVPPAPPDVLVIPMSLSDTLVSGTTEINQLKVKNTGYCNLTVTLSSQANWLVIIPNFSTITPGDSVTVNVHFNASQLFAGYYYSDISMGSNDPDEPQTNVPVALYVTGEPSVTLSSETFDFGSAYVGLTANQTLTVTNTGTDHLHVTQVSSGEADFTADLSSFVLSPGASQNLTLTFAPTTDGAINGVLSITSDDPENPMVTVDLSGIGVWPPEISVTPPNISETLGQNQSSTQNLVIGNEGGNNLFFTASDNASWLSLSPLSGNITPGNTMSLAVTINSASLSPGYRTANIAISSNDPITPVKNIPVTLTVLSPLSVTASVTPTSICSGSSVQLHCTPSGGSGSYNFVWTSDPPGFSSFSQNPVAYPAVTTGYIVNVADGYGNASASVQVTVYENEVPSAVTNMLPADNSFDLSLPVQLSWAPSTNASKYDLYLWPFGQDQPANPLVANLTQISYMYNGGSFSFGDTCKWRVVAKNPCSQTAGPVQVFSLHGLPELHVTEIINSQPLSGQPMTISWTVINDGDYETPAGTIWYDRIWITPDIEVRIGEPEDILIGQFPNLNYLGPGESYTQIQEVLLPANLIGTYFVFVITDALDALFINWPSQGPPLPYEPPPYYTAYTHSGSYVNTVQEYNDNPPWHDNFFYKEFAFAIPPIPDLQVTSVIAPENAFSGQPVNIAWTVTNEGDGITNTTDWSDRVYFTADSELNPANATILGTFNHSGLLLPSTSYTETRSVNIPPYIYGKYYLFVKTDINNAVFEHVFEDNNTGRSDSIHVVLTPPPDLVVSNIIAPDTICTADVFDVSWSVLNQGASAMALTSLYDRVYLCSSPDYNLSNAYTLETFLKSASLQPDSSYMVLKSLSAAQGISGLYYVYVTTDVNNNVFEYQDEDNNTLRSDASVTVINPDLLVTSVTNPAMNNNGQPFNVQWSVKNNGPGNITNRNWSDKILISRHHEYNPDSVTQVDALTYSATLLKGEILNKQKSITLPDNISGIWYIYVYTDYANTLFENTNENNNFLGGSNYIDIVKPDLAVSDVQIPIVDSTGQPVIISWTVANAGLGIIYNRNWKDRIMLSFSSEYNPATVVEIGSLTYTANLQPGDNLLKQASIQLPASVPGPYYIYVYTDWNNAVYENGSEQNNVARSSSTIQILRPDLVVSKIMLPSTASSGDSLNVQWYTKNTGTTGIQNKAWVDRIMLSSSPNYNPGASALLGTKSYSGSLAAGDSLNQIMKVLIPEGLQGTYYIFIYADYNNTIPENINESNNVTGKSVNLVIGTWADLQIIDLQGTDSTMAGSNIPLDFTVKNAGTRKISGKTWTDKVFISSLPNWNANLATFLREFQQSMTLDTDSIYNIQSSINIPGGLSGGDYYIYVKTDANNTVFEDIGESNNISRSDPIHVSEIPPVDLEIASVINPDSLWSGQSVTIQWVVENTGNSATVNSWYDAIYLSSDSIWNGGADIFLAMRMHYGQVNPSGSYSSSYSFSLPNGISGDYYLIVMADYEAVNDDEDPVNNYRSRTGPGNIMIKTHISLTLPSDLIVTILSAPLQMLTGTPFSVSWTVKNQGSGSTPVSSWADKIYLSTDPIINSGDILLGSKTRNGVLGVNQVYNESLEITIPNYVSGNYILLIKTDANSLVFELNEENNLKYRLIILTQPPPADLIVSNIVHPDEVMVGEMATLQWKLKSIGENSVNGTVKDLVYISKDSLWDIQDVLFGSYQSAISLGPDVEITRSIMATLNDIGIGSYYILVRTDVLNSINEIDEDNNTSHSDSTLTADVTQLMLNTLTSGTLFDYKNLYYRIEIADSLNSETMLTTLKGDSLYGSNEMYLKHNDMATRISYDFMHERPYQGNQEIYVPSLIDGNYYMLLYGSTTADNSQDINVKAEILHFGLVSVDANKSGNTGPVTLLMRGSNFDPGMTFQLLKDTAIYADEIMFIDRTKVYANFNLDGAEAGYYDVIADHYCINRDTLFNAFEVVSGTTPELGIEIITPPHIRANRVTSFTIEFANLGNVDLVNPQIYIKSEGGAPIGLTVGELQQSNVELTIPLSETTGPPGLLRPGYLGQVVIYTKSTASLGFTIMVMD